MRESLIYTNNSQALVLLFFLPITMSCPEPPDSNRNDDKRIQLNLFDQKCTYFTSPIRSTASREDGGQRKSDTTSKETVLVVMVVRVQVSCTSTFPEKFTCDRVHWGSRQLTTLIPP